MSHTLMSLLSSLQDAKGRRAARLRSVIPVEVSLPRSFFRASLKLDRNAPTNTHDATHRKLHDTHT